MAGADYFPVSQEFSGFTEITTPGYIEALEVAEISDEGYDPSTNLNCAIVEGLSLLNESKYPERSQQSSYSREESDGEIRQSYLVIFTDGTDQANRVHDVDVIAAVHEAQKSTSIYAVLLEGELAGGLAGSNLE